MGHTFEDIISLENLCLAWEEFVSGKKKQHGVSDFRRSLMDNIIALHEDLKNKVYQHGGYEERHIWDPKHRLIHVAPVRDRLCYNEHIKHLSLRVTVGSAAISKCCHREGGLKADRGDLARLQFRLPRPVATGLAMTDWEEEGCSEKHYMREEKQYCAYIMTNKWNTTLYTGVSGRLPGRVWDHKSKIVKGFTEKYNLTKLVWYEVFDTPEAAIMREKQIKAGSRKRKIELIEKMNPKWKDLSNTLG